MISAQRYDDYDFNTSTCIYLEQSAVVPEAIGSFVQHRAETTHVFRPRGSSEHLSPPLAQRSRRELLAHDPLHEHRRRDISSTSTSSSSCTSRTSTTSSARTALFAAAAVHSVGSAPRLRRSFAGRRVQQEPESRRVPAFDHRGWVHPIAGHGSTSTSSGSTSSGGRRQQARQKRGGNRCPGGHLCQVIPAAAVHREPRLFDRAGSATSRRTLQRSFWSLKLVANRSLGNSSHGPSCVQKVFFHATLLSFFVGEGFHRCGSMLVKGLLTAQPLLPPRADRQRLFAGGGCLSAWRP